MNKRKKLLCTFFVALFLFLFLPSRPIDAFAEGTAPVPTSSSKDPSASSKSGSSSAAASSKPSSSKPTAASSKPAPPPSPKPASSAPASSYQSRRTVTTVTDDFSPSSVASSSSAASSESSVISLPGVDSVSEADPLASVADNSYSHQLNKIGILAWVCIGLGILVILIVILSNRRPPHRPGRSRYHRTKKKNGKRLLNDKYYRGLKRY